MTLSINWTKTMIQDLGGCDVSCQRVSVQGNEVEVVESFVYLGSLIHCSGGSELEIKRRAAFIRESTLHWIRISGVPQSRWKPSSGCIMPVFSQYSSADLRYIHVWSVTSSLSKKIDALDNCRVPQANSSYSLGGFCLK